MRKKPMKMNEDQYQLGIRQLSPHEMVSLIIGYRNDVTHCITLFKQLLQSPTSYLNDIHREWLNITVKNLEARQSDYTVVLEEDN